MMRKAIFSGTGRRMLGNRIKNTVLPSILMNSPDVIYLGLQLKGDLLVPLKGQVQVLHLPAVQRDI
jgi:hypothetical protein